MARVDISVQNQLLQATRTTDRRRHKPKTAQCQLAQMQNQISADQGSYWFCAAYLHSRSERNESRQCRVKYRPQIHPEGKKKPSQVVRGHPFKEWCRGHGRFEPQTIVAVTRASRLEKRPFNSAHSTANPRKLKLQYVLVVPCNL